MKLEKDVNRTDRTHPFFEGENNANLGLLYDILMTYVMYNFDLGYVQGMSDLLSPILILLSNEVDAFWCFVGLMDRVFRNFDMDQAGMKKQLSQLHSLLAAAEPELAVYLDQNDSGNMFFCFRWLLVLFKREFTHDEILRLWETIFTDLPCPNFHLLLCVAILDCEKDILIENKYQFNEILKRPRHHGPLWNAINHLNFFAKVISDHYSLLPLSDITLKPLGDSSDFGFKHFIQKEMSFLKFQEVSSDSFPLWWNFKTHINDLSLKIDLDEIVCRAESIYIQLAATPDLPTTVKRILGLVAHSPTSGSSDDEDDLSRVIDDCETVHIADATTGEAAFEKSISLNYL
ncbi:hypothetical protein J6590_021668 [Homalodisca vitripennis]|nr:hypothetical protein J6590_021668 [Homalodisca vitripennis]